MFLKTTFFIAALLLPLFLHASNESLQNEAMQIAGKFQGTLKPMLKQAMAEGGPVKAIEVCSRSAPQIAKDLSADTGWSVRRVSLKARNAGSATPDQWEKDILLSFDQRALAGEQGSALFHEELVNTSEGKEYRFMKAQTVGGLCLACHGKSLAPKVKTALEQYYPGDRATGYEAGQVRGAISLRKNLPETE